MPERKGRKRRSARERTRGAAAPSTQPAVIDAPRPRSATDTTARRAAANDVRLPSNFARGTGIVLAIVTGVLAVSMVYQAATGDAAGIDGALRIVAGALLIVLAIVVGVLSAFPAMVRDWFQRRR